MEPRRHAEFASFLRLTRMRPPTASTILRHVCCEQEKRTSVRATHTKGFVFKKRWQRNTPYGFAAFMWKKIKDQRGQPAQGCEL